MKLEDEIINILLINAGLGQHEIWIMACDRLRGKRWLAKLFAAWFGPDHWLIDAICLPNPMSVGIALDRLEKRRMVRVMVGIKPHEDGAKPDKRYFLTKVGK